MFGVAFLKARGTRFSRLQEATAIRFDTMIHDRRSNFYAILYYTILLYFLPYFLLYYMLYGIRYTVCGILYTVYCILYYILYDVIRDRRSLEPRVWRARALPRSSRIAKSTDAVPTYCLRADTRRTRCTAPPVQQTAPCLELVVFRNPCLCSKAPVISSQV